MKTCTEEMVDKFRPVKGVDWKSQMQRRGVEFWQSQQTDVQRLEYYNLNT
jgi:hypothetical protein